MAFYSDHHGQYSFGYPHVAPVCHPSMTYRNSNPPISSFSPSYPVQEFRCAEENQYNHHQYYAASSYAPEFHQEHPQPSAQPTPLEELLSWGAEFKKIQQEWMDQMNSQMMQLNEWLSQTPTPQPTAPQPTTPEVQSLKEVLEIGRAHV